MDSNHSPIDQLLVKLQVLLNKQQSFSEEINLLKKELEKLQKQQNSNQEKKKIIPPEKIAPPQITIEKKPQPITNSPLSTPVKKVRSSKNIEKFIGENLINKIGIIILIIGVGIGVKYAINHKLINPLTRIILGYLLGIGLLGIAFKLKKEYHNYSAVLLSGAMAIFYFITFTGYSYYQLFPQILAFGLMVVFTVFTVFASLKYDKQIIAIIGLVGAYAIPLLLSNNSGNIVFLFSYMLLINIGILTLSFKKYWKWLYYTAFVFTWLLFIRWYSTEFSIKENFTTAFIFLAAFFIVFYIIFLAYKLIKKEIFNKTDIILLLINSFIFFIIGYALLFDNKNTKDYLGFFAIGNAFIHFIISYILFHQKLGDKSLFYFVSGLVFVFLTLAIPIQLDGNWVSLLWIGEAALVFWIGRSKQIPFYEKIAYPLLFLAFFSIIQDWNTLYNTYNDNRLIPVFNVQFLSSLLFIGALGFMNFIKARHPQESITTWKSFYQIMSYFIPILLIIVLYFSFRMEISHYWSQKYADSEISIKGSTYPNYTKNYDLIKFKSIWILNYSLLFFSIVSIFGNKLFKTKIYSSINLALNTLVLLIFLIQGLYLFSELRESYLTQPQATYYTASSYSIWIRYISFAFMALFLYITHQYVLSKTDNQSIKKIFDIVGLASILWIASSELINWMDIAQSEQSYKFGLSILWGSFALLLIILGIWKKQQHIRIAAIVLFLITLLKLFFYDISKLNSLAKTIAFISLGILLLIISFLYNKYKHLIFDENKN